MTRSHRVLLLFALMALSFVAVPLSVDAGKKKHKKHQKKKKLGAQNAACALKHGMGQDECTGLISKGCPVTWVEMCADPSLDGFGGCQVVNNCPHMKCPSTCSKNGNCHWDYTSKTCASGSSLGKFCQVTERDDGKDAFLSPDKTQAYVNTTNGFGAAITCTTSKTVNDWYFLVEAESDPGEIYFGVSPGPFDLSDDCSLWLISGCNPSTNPEGGFWFADYGLTWSDLQYKINFTDSDCTGFGSNPRPGDVVGVHLDRAKGQVWWDVNGVNPRSPCQLVQSNVSATLEYYGVVTLNYDSGTSQVTHLG